VRREASQLNSTSPPPLMPPLTPDEKWLVATYIAGWAAYTAVAWKLYPNTRATSVVLGLAWPYVWPAAWPILLFDLAWKLDGGLPPR
jgi:hypothetical protein